MIKKNISRLVGVFVLLVGAVAGLSLLNRDQDIREEAAPASTITLTGVGVDPINIPVDVKVNVDPGPNQIIAAQMYIRFDPRFIRVNNIAQGSFFSGQTEVFAKEVDNVNGVIYFAYGNVPTNRTPATSLGTVATINITPIAVTAGIAMTFDRDRTVLGAIGDDTGINVTQTYNDLNLRFVTPTPTPTPTRILSPTPTPTIVARPDLTITTVSAGVVGSNPFTFTATVRNNGNIGIATGTPINFYAGYCTTSGCTVSDNAMSLVNTRTSGLSVNQTYQISLAAPGGINGYFFYRGYVDFNKTLVELNEGNNEYTMSGTSIPTPTFTGTPTKVPTNTPTFTPTPTYTPTPTCALGSSVFMSNTINPQNNMILNSLTTDVELWGKLDSLNSCGNPVTLEYWRGQPNPSVSENEKLCVFTDVATNTEYLCEIDVMSGSRNTWTVVARHTDRAASITRTFRVAYPGDCDVSGVVDIVDYGILFYNFAKKTFDIKADINGDGFVDIVDYSYLFYNFGKSV